MKIEITKEDLAQVFEERGYVLRSRMLSGFYDVSSRAKLSRQAELLLSISDALKDEEPADG